MQGSARIETGTIAGIGKGIPITRLEKISPDPNPKNFQILSQSQNFGKSNPNPNSKILKNRSQSKVQKFGIGTRISWDWDPNADPVSGYRSSQPLFPCVY